MSDRWDFAREGASTSSFGRGRDQMSDSYGSRRHGMSREERRAADRAAREDRQRRERASKETRIRAEWEAEVKETEADPKLRETARVIGELKKSPPAQHRVKGHAKKDNSHAVVSKMAHIKATYYTTGLEKLLANTLWRGQKSVVTVHDARGDVNELKEQASAMNAQLHTLKARIRRERASSGHVSRADEEHAANLQKHYDEHMAHLKACLGTKQVVSHKDEYSAAKLTVEVFNAASNDRASRTARLKGEALSNLIKDAFGISRGSAGGTMTLDEYYASIGKAPVPAAAPTPAPERTAEPVRDDEGWRMARGARAPRMESKRQEREIVYVPDGTYIPRFKREWTKHESERPTPAVRSAPSKPEPRGPAFVVAPKSQLTGWASLAAKAPEKPRVVVPTITTPPSKPKYTKLSFALSTAPSWNDDGDDGDEDDSWGSGCGDEEDGRWGGSWDEPDDYDDVDCSGYGRCDEEEYYDGSAW